MGREGGGGQQSLDLCAERDRNNLGNCSYISPLYEEE